MTHTGGRARAGVFLGISAIAALLGVGLVGSVIHSYETSLEAMTRPPETVRVVIATRTIHAGHTINLDDVETVEMKPAFVPDAAYFELEEVIGRVAAERILPRDPIRRERLALVSAGTDMVALVPRGMRAVSLNVAEGAALSGFVEPGNYIDVLITVTKDSGADAGRHTLTLLQAKKVLAVDSRLDPDEEAAAGRDGVQHAPSVTIIVDPAEAQDVAHALSVGSVTLTLRNDVDVMVRENTASVHRIIGEVKAVEFVNVPKPRPRVPNAGPTPTWDLIHGTRIERLPIPAH